MPDQPTDPLEKQLGVANERAWIWLAWGVCRRMWPRLDALATMIELAGETYERWLDRPQPVLAALRNVAEPQILRIAWGKLMLVGTRRPPAAPPL